MGRGKQQGAPMAGEEKKIQFRVSIKKKIIDSLGEDFIREICAQAIEFQYLQKSIKKSS